MALTERDILRCLNQAGCLGTVKMTYDAGPYEITRTTINSDAFARAIESAACAERDKQLAERDARIAELERQLAEAYNKGWDACQATHDGP